MVDLGDWNAPLAPLFESEKYKQIRAFLIDEYRNQVIYPDMRDLYNCFRFTPFKDLRVVLLGQDPYHNENHLDINISKHHVNNDSYPHLSP